MSSNNVYRNFQLYRTTPRLSGNVMWDIVVEPTFTDSQNTLEVRDFHIRPISDRIPYKVQIDENLLVRPHQLNIKRFYNQIKSNFYKDVIDPQLSSDWPYLVPSTLADEQIRYIKRWDDTYWGGTRRMSYALYNTTHETMIPLWLEVISELYIDISIDTVGSNPINIITKRLIIKRHNLKPRDNGTFHERFCNYFLDYLKYVSIYSDKDSAGGNNNCISLSFKDNLTTIKGLNIESGNYITRNDYNVVRNLMFRERPLLEANSLLTNLYRDTKLITPQLFNLNICYDPSNWVKGMNDLVSNTPNFQISTKVSAIWGQHTEPITLSKGDLYTNHYFVPRQYQSDRTGTDSSDEWLPEQTENALDYLQDYKITDIMHSNKISQPICHWVITSDTDTLFNVYDGFGSWWTDANGNKQHHDHTQGGTVDPDNDKFAGDMSNVNWTGRLRRGDGDDIEEILNNPRKFIYEDKYLLSTSGYINGLKFNYTKKNPEDPDDIYIGLMTTEIHAENSSQNPATSWRVMNREDTIAMWVNRKSYDPNNPRVGVDTLVKYGQLPGDLANYPSPEYFANFGQYDKDFDVVQHHDLDNRYGKWVNRKYPGYGGGGVSVHNRSVPNQYGFYISMRRKIIHDKNNQPKDILTVIFWSPYVSKVQYDNTTSDKIVYGTQLPDALTIGAIRKAIKNYKSYYDKVLKDENGNWLPDVPQKDRDNLDNLDNIDKGVSTLQVMSTIFFENSILPLPDETISKQAQEKTYYKISNVNHYVYRYPESIVPAIFLPAAQRPDPVEGITAMGLHYANRYGRNFLWLKDLLKNEEVINFDTNYKQYIYTNVPPRYPSLNYDCVKRLYIPDTLPVLDENGDVVKNEDGQEVTMRNDARNKYGDLMYTEPLPIFSGKTMDNREPEIKDYPDRYTVWAEYKWFDRSRITLLNKEFKFNMKNVLDNSQEYLKQSCVKAVQQSIGEYTLANKTQLIDITFLESVYDITYELQSTLAVDPGDNEEYQKYVGSDGKTILYEYNIYMKLK